jgi:glyceraldehyde-3-phosphate dehydrogenase type I
MGTIRVGINGMGRIGRGLLREWSDRKIAGLEIVAVNNPGNPDSYLHLLEFDSVHGKMKAHLEQGPDGFFVDGKKIKFYGEKDPAKVPWDQDNIDVVIDATGRFKDQESLSKHLRGTVKKVILCAPGKGLDGTFVIGINHNTYDSAKHNIISNASCTTNCLAPLAKVVHENFGIKTGFMTTVHAYTSDQQLLDGAHSDPRRARTAALSMIPTSTGAAQAVGLVLPDLNGKLQGYAVRVPTANVSMVDFTAELEKPTTIDELNKKFLEASEGELKGILKVCDKPLVSVDYNGMKESSCIDTALTLVNGNSIKVVSWYDNEIGFSNRVLDLASFIGSKL